MVHELPHGEELIKKVQNLVQAILQLEQTQFTIEADINPITQDPDYNRIFVGLPNRSYVNRLYEAQPYFGALVCHKLTHVSICPKIRYSNTACLMCSSEKNRNCIRDMCTDCCARQKHINLICPCSTHTIQEMLSKRKEHIKDMSINPETVCEKCTNPRDASIANKLCVNCYMIQGSRTVESSVEESIYWKELKEMDPVTMARTMLAQVSEIHIKVRGELKAGRYDWFKPIYGSNILEYMIKANKELQEVIDNGNLIRGQTTKKFLKEGKIFTKQANDP